MKGYRKIYFFLFVSIVITGLVLLLTVFDSAYLFEFKTEKATNDTYIGNLLANMISSHTRSGSSTSHVALKKSTGIFGTKTSKTEKGKSTTIKVIPSAITNTAITKAITFTKHNINNVSTTIYPEYEKGKKWFFKKITDHEKNVFRSLVKVFHEALFPNVTYFMYGGTLLGSYRNHGMIPWDDDMDLCVDNSQKPMLEKRLNALGSEFELNKRVSYSWKFTFKNSTRTRYGWNWPFLDIFFFTRNRTHIWDISPSLRKYKYKQSMILPVIKRPFMGMLLSAPRDTYKTLTCLFDVDECHSPTYDHKKEIGIGSKNAAKMPCTWLCKDFQFVRRERILNTTYEILMDNDHVSVYDPVGERFAFF